MWVLLFQSFRIPKSDSSDIPSSYYFIILFRVIILVMVIPQGVKYTVSLVLADSISDLF